jgi:hypothetical protein
MADLEYERKKEETVNDGRANGVRGDVKINVKSWYTIERMDGYKWLRPDNYEAEFGEWTSSSGKKSKAIRVLGEYSQGRIYFHPANKPVELAGCIAPGKTKTSTGVGDSRNALLEMFDELGGYVEGKKLSLKVEGEMPEDAIKGDLLEPGEVEGVEYEEPDSSELID